MKTVQSPPDPRFSLLIKPVSADCNLRCGYCFYWEKRSLYPQQAGTKPRMNGRVLDKMIKSFLALPMPEHLFGWQGGEPLLAGLDFFRQAVALQRRHGRPGARIGNSLQTNGLLLDREWCAFLREHRFLVGLSLDGPEKVHNLHRTDRKGRGAFSDAMRAMELLTAEGVEFNVLTVISGANVHAAGEVYAFLKGLGLRYHQYIPAVVSAEKAARPSGFEISGDSYGRFLLDLFEAWHPADVKSVSIRLFDSIVNRLVRGRAGQCTMEPSCGGYLVVEHNGDLYPCDFFVEKEWLLGNIRKQGWAEIRAGEKYRRFAAMKATLPAGCGGCPFLEFCFGDCTRHRSFDGRDFTRKSTLCEGIRMFLEETLPAFKALAEDVRKKLF